MFTPRSLFKPLAFAASLSLHPVSAQTDPVLMDEDGIGLFAAPVIGSEELPDPYAPLNAALGGDSTRLCKGMACAGWVEDRYPDGTLRHRGYYGDGRLITYRNFFTDGRVEREFKVQDVTRCSMRTFYEDGTLRSETHYVEGVSRTFTEHYPDGKVRYTEERHPSLPCYKVMDLFAPDGKPISTLQLIDKKKVIFEQREYWPNGQLRASGRSQFNPHRYDSQRIGSWTYYDTAGTPLKEERYIEGKVHETADL